MHQGPRTRKETWGRLGGAQRFCLDTTGLGPEFGQEHRVRCFLQSVCFLVFIADLLESVCRTSFPCCENNPREKTDPAEGDRVRCQGAKSGKGEGNGLPQQCVGGEELLSTISWWYPNPWMIKSLRAAVPDVFGTRDLYRGRQFFEGQGWGWFWDDSSALHLLCTLFLLVLHCDM